MSFKSYQRFPLGIFKKHCAWHIRGLAAQFCQMVDAPGYNHINCQASLNSICAAKLTAFYFTAALERAMIYFNSPPNAIPTQSSSPRPNTRPAKTGIPPETPPQIMQQLHRRRINPLKIIQEQNQRRIGGQDKLCRLTERCYIPFGADIETRIHQPWQRIKRRVSD